MRSLILLSIIVILLRSIESTGANWIERMTKYGDLVRCQYYVTSQTNFDHFIPIDETTSMIESQDEYLMQLKFYTTAQYSFKIYLAASNDSIESEKPIIRYSYSAPEYGRPSIDDVDDFSAFNYKLYTPSTTQAPDMTTNAAEGKNEIHKHHIGYQIDISSTQTSIKTDEKPIKTLLTPETLKYNEPNEVLIYIFKDGQLKVAVNDIEAMHTHVEFGNQLKYFSFASGGNYRREEFFYECA